MDTKDIKPRYTVMNAEDLDRLGPFEGPEPDPGFLSSIQAFGIIYPVLVSRNTNNDRLTVVDGRRRIKAALKLGLMAVPVAVYDDLSTDDSAAWSLILNEQRSKNVISELLYYNQLAESDNWEQLQKEYGFNKAHIEKILRLNNIEELDTFISAFECGKITESGLFELSKLGHERQTYALNVLQTKGKLTSKDISEAKKMKQAEAMASMPSLDNILEEEARLVEDYQFALLLNDNSVLLFVDSTDAYNAVAANASSILYRLFRV